MMNVEVISSNENEAVVSLIPAGDPNLSKRVNVHLYVHDSGVVTIDIDAESRADIDVDVYDYTAMIVRNGKVEGE